MLIHCVVAHRRPTSVAVGLHRLAVADPWSTKSGSAAHQGLRVGRSVVARARIAIGVVLRWFRLVRSSLEGGHGYHCREAETVVLAIDGVVVEALFVLNREYLAVPLHQRLIVTRKYPAILHCRRVRPHGGPRAAQFALRERAAVRERSMPDDAHAWRFAARLSVPYRRRSAAAALESPARTTRSHAACSSGGRGRGRPRTCMRAGELSPRLSCGRAASVANREGARGCRAGLVPLSPPLPPRAPGCAVCSREAGLRGAATTKRSLERMAGSMDGSAGAAAATPAAAAAAAAAAAERAARGGRGRPTSASLTRAVRRSDDAAAAAVATVRTRIFNTRKGSRCVLAARRTFRLPRAALPRQVRSAAFTVAWASDGIDARDSERGGIA
eukprot:scaffold603_cov404-Prasinococcus_capsulatus_cf.AAC.9